MPSHPGSRRQRPASAFCKATGLSEDMLRHVLAGRKDLSLEALTKGLERIGYPVRIVLRPAAPGRQPAARGRTAEAALVLAGIAALNYVFSSWVRWQRFSPKVLPGRGR